MDAHIKKALRCPYVGLDMLPHRQCLQPIAKGPSAFKSSGFLYSNADSWALPLTYGTLDFPPISHHGTTPSIGLPGFSSLLFYLAQE